MDQDTYPCVNASKGCQNTITFTKEDEERFLQRGFMDQQGRVTKPKYCRPCKAKMQAERENRERENRR